MTTVGGSKTRTVMWDMSAGLEVLFFVAAAVALIVFAYGITVPILRYRRGNRAGMPPVRELPQRIAHPPS